MPSVVLAHILGAVLVLVGILVFVFDQITGREDRDSRVEAWKINLTGPPAIVLIVIGVVVFLYPLSPWWPEPDDPNPPVVITTVASVATTAGVATTETTLLPLSPTGFDVYFDDTCGADVIEWYQDDIENIGAWWISVESYDPATDEVVASFEIDSGTDILAFGNVSALCSIDFLDTELALYYYLWIYPYNADGFAVEPLFVQYNDF